MAAENYALALCYSGEAASAMDLNENLAYSVPKEGSNFWIDSWFIPQTCQDIDAVYEFLNYTCRDDVAMANFEYVYYASPVSSVDENMDEELKENESLYRAVHPTEADMANCEVYRLLNDEMTELYNDLWARLKAN